MERQDPQTGVGEPGFEAQPAEDIAEMEITEPTLTWLEVSHPQQPIPIGDNDRVLNSNFNEQHDVWEVLLVAMPNEEGESEEE